MDRKQSTKEVRSLKEIMGERIFTLPRSMANDVDTITGQPCLFVGINGRPYYIPVESPSPIPYNVFCALKDLGILDYYSNYEEGQQFEQ